MTAAVAAVLAAPGGAATSNNLIKNPGAEAGPGATSATAIVAVPKWTTSNGHNFTAVVYGTSGGFPASKGPGLPTKHGKNFFAGGPVESVTSEVAVQTVNLKPYLAAIQSGSEPFTASAWLGGYSGQSDNAELEITWKHGKNPVGTDVILGPVTESDRGGVTKLLQRTATGTVPATANHAYVQLIMSPISGGYNDGYADNLSLTLG
jgi:hypothetical protein